MTDAKDKVTSTTKETVGRASSSTSSGGGQTSNFEDPSLLLINKNTQIDSESKNRSISRRTFAAIVISMSMILASILMLPTKTNDSFAQGSNTNNTATSQSSSEVR